MTRTLSESKSLTPAVVRAEAGVKAGVRGNPADLLLLGSLVILYLAPLFWMLVPPTQDGPAHVSIAYTLEHLLAHDRPDLERYFEINWFPEPNLSGHLALIAFLRFTDPFQAEKILFGIFIVTLPLAALYAIRSVNPHGSTWLTLLIVPFSFTKLMQAGFYNFCLSLSVFYVCLGYFLRKFPNFNARRATVLALLTLLLYFSHAMSMAMFFASVALLTPWLIWKDSGHTGVKGHLEKLRWLLAGLAPAGVLYAAFLVRNRGAAHAYSVSVLDRLTRLAVLSSLVTHRRIEMVCSVGVLLFFVGLLAIYAMRRQRPWKLESADCYLLLTAFFLAFLFLVPDHASGGSAHSQRAELYPFLVLPLWFAAQPPLQPKVRRAFAALSVVLGIGVWYLNAVQFHKIDGAVREYYSVAPHIQSGSTVLPVVLDSYGRDAEGTPLSARDEIFSWAGDRLNPMSGAIELNNYQASAPGFVVRYRAGVTDWTQLRPDETWNKFAEEIEAGRLSGNPDYVLLYGWDPTEIRKRTEFRDFDPDEVLRSLERLYTLEFVSQPAGAVRLYRRSSELRAALPNKSPELEGRAGLHGLRLHKS